MSGTAEDTACPPEAERLREGEADDHQQERCEGEGPVGDQPDHRAKGFGETASNRLKVGDPSP